MFRSITKTLTGGLSQTTPPQVQPTIVGGTSNLHSLLDKVTPSNSVADRIRAADSIRTSIDTYSVSSIPEIWYSVKDMISSTYPQECRRAGLKLMISCIERDEKTYGSRMVYYNSIINNPQTTSLQDSDLRLEALKSLTLEGTDVHDLFLSNNRISTVLSSWFAILASEANDIRSGLKKDPLELWGTSTETNLHTFLQFLIDIVRHHHSFFSNKEISILLAEAVQVCQKTSSAEEMKYCIDFIDVVISCSYIPAQNLPSLLDMLSRVAASRADQAWEVIKKLSTSYVSNSTLSSLCDILEAADTTSNSDTLSGAASYLQRLALLYTEEKRDAEISITNIMHAYKCSLVVDSMRHNYEICCCIYSLLENKSTRKLFTYDVWESIEHSPLEVIFRISQSPDIQAVALHPKNNNQAKPASAQPSPSYPILNTQNTFDGTSSILAKFQEIFTLLGTLCNSEDQEFLGSKESIVSFLVNMSPFIDEPSALIVIEYYKTWHYCNPLSRNWISNTDQLLENFFRDASWGPLVRQKVLGVIHGTFEIAMEICDTPELIVLTDKVFQDVLEESDSVVLHTMMELFEGIATESSYEVLDHISAIFMEFFESGASNKSVSASIEIGSETSKTSAMGGEETERLISPAYRKQIVAIAFCKIFVSTFCISGSKACRAYNCLFTICKNSANDPLAYIEAARLLCRLRVSAENFIFISTPTNMDGLAASVGRNLNGVSDFTSYKDSMSWWYPETISYLHDDDLESVSYVLKIRTVIHAQHSVENDHEIDISLWFNEIMEVIEHGGHWEIYSFIWAHFGPQLANVQLFYQSGCDIQRLRQVICDQILNKSETPKVIFPKDLSRNDIKVALIRTTSSLLSYHDIFTKHEEDYIVRAFVDGLNTSEKAVVPCIHGLVVSCYELPLSIKKYLGQIFTKFQTKITNSSTSPHILEFLLSLSRLPSLTDNFTQDEYKRVFGMAIKYIQYAYQLAQQEQGREPRANNARPGVGIIQNTIDSSNSKVLSQYLLVLAYNVIATWFLTLRLPDRKYMAKFIIRNLILAEGTSDAIDTQSLAYVDIISRFTYSNLDLTVMTPPPAQTDRVSKQWIYGASIVSISTDSQTGESQIMIRRPTGTSVFNMKPDESMIPGWMEEFFMKLSDSESSENISQQLLDKANEVFSASHVLLQLIPFDTQPSVKPLQIPNGPEQLRAATARALGAFDRTPVVDFHKVGVMYIAPGQHDELDILGNSVGSVNYTRFLQRMGKLVRLKDNHKIYTGGLDISNDVDGEYAYVWSDKVTQLIFHTTTMMPPPANPHDTSFASKKRHIGNDFVNIFFDESEVPFEFGLVKSQFNFINISITPISVTFSRSGLFIEHSDMEENLSGPSNLPNSDSKMFYKVRALCKPGVPAIFAACHLKIVSEDSLARFVRNLAIISSKFATVWNSQGGYISHWQYRLEQINALREKILTELNKASSGDNTNKDNAPSQAGPSRNQDENVGKNEEVGQSFLDQLSGNATNSKERKVETVPAFSMDEPDSGDMDMPLLKNLDFSTFL